MRRPRHVLILVCFLLSACATNVPTSAPTFTSAPVSAATLTSGRAGGTTPTLPTSPTPTSSQTATGSEANSATPLLSTRTLTATPRPRATSALVQIVTPRAIQTRVSGNAPMVFVPAGEFLMGSANDPLALWNEMPQHRVTLDAFWIDEYEVTNALYAQCVAAQACPPPVQFRSNTRAHYYDDPAFADYPVIYVRWIDAQAFCAWNGKRLPTEAEWEKAARGPNGNIYPWGNVFDATRVNSFEGGVNDTLRVGSLPNGVSAYGAYDMAGNVSEWVNDYYQRDYYRLSPALNPPGPLSTLPRTEAVGIMRGGAWLNDKRAVRSAFRLGYWQRHNWYEAGFRCAASG